MFADPQSITVNSVAQSCPRVIAGDLNCTYKEATGAFQLRISHQETSKRIRRMVRIDQKKVAADPLTAVNAYQTAGVYVVVDEPVTGFSDTELEYLVTALKNWLTAGNIAKVLASES